VCGIVGYVGSKNGIEAVFNGLIRLEYRGYDSVGVAFKDKNKIKTVKSHGRIKKNDVVPGMPNLEEKLKEDEKFKFNSNIVIGHTRWATHGAPSEKNAHPHVSMKGNFAIVHNGIIENYLTLKNELINKGYKFESETDSEVLAHLIEYFYENDILSAVKKALTKLEGAYSFLVLSEAEDVIVGAKKGSPLCLGLGEKEFIISSDESPFIDRTKKVIYINDGELILIEKNKYNIINFEGLNVEREIEEVPYDLEAITKGGYDHFMLKEIHEQPTTIKNAFISRIDHLDTMLRDNFPKLPRNINRVIYLACGTSLCAGKVGMYITEKYAKIPSRAEYASEFIYRDPVIFEKDICIALSQSGETADTKEALKIVKEKNAYIAGLVNVVGSQIARIAGKGMYLHAGPEIGVASTKAFTSQVVAINMFNMLLIDDIKYREKLIDELKKLPDLAEQIIRGTEPKIKVIAPEISKFSDFLYLGRDINYPVALEGALKMKEIAYLHAEGYSSGEMKHGPIALIDKNLLTVCILTGEKEIYKKTLNNLLEIKARSGRVFVLTDDVQAIKDHLSDEDYIIEVPKTLPQLSPIINVIPLQLLAYYTAKHLKREIDKPRNLAKSVTVE